MLMLSLIQNIALLVALAAVYQVVAARLKKDTLSNQIISGVLFGSVAIIGMMNPLHFSAGIIFDGRSMILNVAGLFGGPIVASIGALLCGSYRVYLGGGGVYVGVATIVESALIGIVFHYLWYVKNEKLTFLRLWLFGLLANLVVVATFLALPGGVAAVKQIGLTYIIFFPLATVLLCQLFIDYEKQISDAEALHESEQLYRGVFENAAAGVLVGDANGRFLKVNNRLCDMLGYTKSELLEKTIYDITHDLDRDITFEKGKRLFAGELDSYDLIKRYLHKDGHVVWVEISVSAIHGPDGDVRATIALVSDITARMQAEQALQDRERMWATMLGNLPGFVYRCANDRNWTMEFISHGCQEVTGYSPEDFTMNKTVAFNDIVDPRHRERLWNKWQEVLERKELFEDEYKIIARDGSLRWVWERGRGIFGEEGELLFLEGFITDVTQRKEMEESLRDGQGRYQELFEKSKLQEELYLSMLNCSADPIIVYGMDGRVRYLNPAHTELFGWKLEEVQGQILNTVPQWDMEKTGSIIAGILETGKTNWSYETQRLTKDGRLVDVSISGARYSDHDGKPAGMVVILQNISARKKAEEVQRRLATVIEQAAEIVIITDLAGKIQYVNPAFERITGYTTKEAIGQSPRFLKSDQHEPGFYRYLWETITRGEVWSGRMVNRKKDGTIFYEDATISPVFDRSGKITNYVGVKRDVTETVELTKQLLHSQKMEAIGTLAGGIAHDFNNLLQVVMGYCEILMSNAYKNSPHYQDLQKIYYAGKKGADLVRKLLTFSRNQQSQMLPTNLNHEIAQIRDLLNRTITKAIEIDLKLSDDLNLINADPAQLAQVIMNLALNARDAMPDGGTLSIETQNLECNEEFCNRVIDLEPGSYVCLKVSDTGSGMDPSIMEHIFEPFYSTKEVGKGTGLGLATVYGIVKNHRGHIACESEPEKGTTFSIYFPAIVNH